MLSAGLQLDKSTPLSQLFNNEKKEMSTLDTLNCTRNNFLANIDATSMTEEEMEQVAQYLARLDCHSVLKAADFAQIGDAQQYE